MQAWRKPFLSVLVPALVRWGVIAGGGAAPARADEGDRGPDLTPRQILERIDNLYRGESSQGKMSMKIVRENWSRGLKLEFWTRGTENTLIRILDPAKERGTATLKTDGNIWSYLPRVNRVIKIPASMMGSSWMGSHFTHDDLVKQSRFAEDYESVQTFSGEKDGASVVEITCTPKAGTPVVWGQVVARVSRDDWLPRTLLFFDENLNPVRTLSFDDFRPDGEVLIPRVARMVPAEPPGERTEILYEELAFDVVMPDDWFSIRQLQR